MTISEFKAWLEGYSEAFDNAAPNPEQWAKIREKLESVGAVADKQIERGDITCAAPFQTVDSTGHRQAAWTPWDQSIYNNYGVLKANLKEPA